MELWAIKGSRCVPGVGRNLPTIGNNGQFLVYVPLIIGTKVPVYRLSTISKNASLDSRSMTRKLTLRLHTVPCDISDSLIFLRQFQGYVQHWQ